MSLLPFRHSPHEHLIMRAMLAATIWSSTARMGVHPTQPNPHGLARWFDLTFWSDRATADALHALLALALVLLVVNRFALLALSYILWAAVTRATLHHSQGAIGHAHQMVALVTLGLFVAEAQRVLSRRFDRLKPEARRSFHDLGAHYARQAIAAVYMCAALSKLMASRGQWVADSAGSIPMMMTANYRHYYNSLDAAALAEAHRILGLLGDHPHVLMAGFAGVLLLELGAVAGLSRRWLAVVVGCLLIAFHEGSWILLKLRFKFNEALLLIYFMGAAWPLAWLWRRLASARIVGLRFRGNRPMLAD